MGFFTAYSLSPEYFDAINGKSAKYISPPVRSQFGFHVIKILGVKKFKDINLGAYKKIVYDQKRNAILRNYFKRLRKNAKIAVDKNVLKSLK